MIDRSGNRITRKWFAALQASLKALQFVFLAGGFSIGGFSANREFLLSAAEPPGAAVLADAVVDTERRPVAIVLRDDPFEILVANRAGTLAVIDGASNKLLREHVAGTRLSHAVSLEQGRKVLVADEAAGELRLLHWCDADLRHAWNRPVCHSPIALLPSLDERSVCVASLWGRRLYWLALDAAPAPAVVENDPRDRWSSEFLDLPFAPRRLVRLSSERIVAIDAFGGRLAVVNESSRRVEFDHELDAHNIAGACLSHDQNHLLVTHQRLSAKEPTTPSNVHWGEVIRNVVRRLPVDWLLSSQREAPAGGLFFLGYPDSATGDPAAILETTDRRQIVALAGISQVGISDVGANYFRQIDVGRRPIALAVSPRRQQLYVACMNSDSLEVIDLERLERSATVMLCKADSPNSTATNLAARGEELFYDARLSSDGWYSCHSCHTEGHSNGRLNDNATDGTYGDPKRVPSLLGTADTGPWAWNGRFQEMESQIRHSIETTMQGPSPNEDDVRAIAAFLKTMPPAPSLAETRRPDSSPGQELAQARARDRGQQFFQRSGCADCHAPARYTTPGTYDVGLHSSQGERSFNPPSLRGVSQRQRLFHDNRATNLREIFEEFQHGLDAPPAPGQLDDLLAFLQSL